MQPEPFPSDPSAAAAESALAWSRGAAIPFPDTLTVAELFERQVASASNAIAVIDGEVRCTYAELDSRANAVAARLRDIGAAECFVGLRTERTLAFVAAALGIAKARAAFVPLDFDREPPARLARLRAACAFVLDPATFETTRAGAPRTIDPAVACVFFTSGSTGAPKGVLVPHRGIARLVCGADYVSLSARDTLCLSSNLSFDAATFELWGALLNGARLIVTPTETLLSAPALARHFAEHGVTTLFLTTALFNGLTAQDAALFAPLEHLLFGGEMADPHAVQRVLEQGKPRALLHVYGPTEATTFATSHHVERVDEVRVPIGRPIANTDAFILDAALAPLPPDREGDLFLGGPGLALGYLDDAALSAERFIEHPRFGRLYRTGDRARWRADGVIDFVGRADGQIKLRGFRIEPGEVEAALREHPAVCQCAVAACPAPSGEPILAAFWTGEAADAESLRAHVRARLPEQMLPAAFVRLDALPLTPSGKVDRRALSIPSGFQAGVRPGFISPQTALERRIAGVWQEALGLAAIGLDDHFFELGGSSLLAIRVHARLCAEVGRDLRIVALFQHPTVRSLARHIDSAKPPPAVFPAARARAEKRRAALAQRSLSPQR